ncbi:MAG: MFS transporter [Elusimicrobia bacterium]|nr:MFS transporter [Elusimicrobiota bacterium]
MGVAVLESELPPVPKLPFRAPLLGFLGGTLATQVVNSAYHIAQVLLIADLSGSFGKAAFFAAAETAVHMGGTALAGWPADKLGPRRLLILSTFSRALCLGTIPLAWALGRLSIHVAIAAYTVDALIRGMVDTSVHALPLTLSDGERSELDRLNSRYELVYDLGSAAGPMILGGLLATHHGMLANVFIAVGFAAAAGIYSLVPSERRGTGVRVSALGGGTWEGLRLAWAEPSLLVACLGMGLLNLYPLRKLLTALFAKALLHRAAVVGWVGGAFGLGGALGSALYAWKGSDYSGASWIVGGSLGATALAVGWVPGAVMPMGLAAFLFGALNVCARLALTRRVQEATPERLAGGVTAVARFASNVASVCLKSMVGAAFALGIGARGAFAVVGAGLMVVAGGQVWLAVRVGRDEAGDPAAEPAN